MCESKKWTSRNHPRDLKNPRDFLQGRTSIHSGIILSVNLYFSWLLYDVIFDVNFIFIFPHFWNGNLKRIEILIIVKWLRALFSFIIRELARIGSSIGYLYFISQSVFRGMLFSIAETNSIRVVCYVITHVLNKNTKFCRFSIFLTRS